MKDSITPPPNMSNMYESCHLYYLTACHSSPVHQNTACLSDNGCFMTIGCHICWHWRKCGGKKKKKFYKIPGLKCHNKKSNGISNLYLNT